MWESPVTAPNPNGPLISKKRLAAGKGDAQAQFELCQFYYWGTSGVDKDDTEAAKWCLQSAEQGFLPAERLVADMYDQGRGVRQDDAESLYWHYRAADMSSADAKRLETHLTPDEKAAVDGRLSEDYQRKIQTALDRQDNVSAMLWYHRAGLAGSEAARRLANNLPEHERRRLNGLLLDDLLLVVELAKQPRGEPIKFEDHSNPPVLH